MADSEEPTGITEGTPLPRWSRWRWPLVVPAFLLGWTVGRWIITGVLVYEDHQLPAGFIIVSAGYTIAGFLPVYLAAGIAPTRQLLIAIVCALLVVAWQIGPLVQIPFQWRDETKSNNGLVFLFIWNCIALVAAAAAVWAVKRRRESNRPGMSKWVWATGLMLPVASVGYIYVRGLFN